MKKLIVIALAVVMALSVVAFAACGGEKTVTGDCHYDNYGHTYGVKVDVTVKGGVITAVKLYTDAESGYVRTSEGWTTPGIGHDAAEAAYEGWINEKIVGQSVETVKGWEVTAGIVDGKAVTEIKSGPVITGATQSSARILAAVQDALNQL